MDNQQIEELVYVRTYIVNNLEATGQNVSTSNIASALLSFDSIFKDGISAMYRFITWMQEHGYTEHDIFPTLIHDLNGMRDDCFSPRTSSY